MSPFSCVVQRRAVALLSENGRPHVSRIFGDLTRSYLKYLGLDEGRGREMCLSCTPRWVFSVYTGHEVPIKSACSILYCNPYTYPDLPKVNVESPTIYGCPNIQISPEDRSEKIMRSRESVWIWYARISCVAHDCQHQRALFSLALPLSVLMGVALPAKLFSPTRYNIWSMTS